MTAEPILYLLAGLILLFTGGEFLVRGGVSLASNFKISTLVVGVTVVSFGTSAPELVVSIEAAISGHPDIAMGNVIGSNIANIALVLGLTMVIMPVVIDSKSLMFNISVMIGVSFLLLFFVVFDNKLFWWQGMILFTLLIVFVWHSIRKSRINLRNGIGEIPERKYSLPVSIIIIIISCIGLVFGARFLVNGATEVARTIGVSERAISVSVIALGTSLPELVTSAIAAFRKHSDISVGNIIGSNIFNILGILGVSSGILVIPGSKGENAINISEKMLGTDLMVCIGLSLLLLLFLLPLRRIKLGRYKGIVFMVIYVSYIYIVFHSDPF
ncbi:MAG: calcium/sodium antiporter [Bacteroidales bacterium]|nr:calcium/sodium antiporter [Bacteroidales bacterium]